MMVYFVRSEDGCDYSVGWWRDGTYHDGSREDAVHEARLLRSQGESTAYAWGFLLVP